ncbi:hypothetical protein N1851_027050 [Merluccius polli]|uniref:Uncharacterized protein n=1 Tax=Merluccius polli TaxID=89951 RepID=A0AA47MB23_MERPO|nr:hypothetical protein N1851_027050 [Merluccius polli]
METPGDDVTAHPSRKRRKSASAGPTASLDMPGTHEEELRRKRKKEKKKRRIEAECMETIELEDDGGRGQEPASEEAGQSTSQETTQRKKKKKKKKKELVVIDDDEEEDEGNKDSEVSAVIETSITKKGALAKSKKKNEKKKKSVVVTEAMDDNTPEAALSKERPESDLVAPHGALLGVAPVCKEKKRRGRKKEQDNTEELERGEYLDQMKELLLYVPDAKTRSSEVIVKMLRQDLPRFREFKAKGSLYCR